MGISLLADVVTVATTQGLAFAKFASQNLSLVYETTFQPSESSSSPAFATLTISAGLLPVDAISAPLIRPNSYRSAPRILSRRIRRTKRRSLTGESDEDGFSGSDDGPFGGGGSGGGGGRGWNSGGSSDWEGEGEGEYLSYSDPASDFIYEVLGWIALSNCVHFAFKKVVRIMAGGAVGDSSREKASMC